MGTPENGYDPREALLGYKQGLKALMRKADREKVPQGLVDVSGKELHTEVETGPATVCILLLAFLNRHPMVPDDFHNVPRSKKGIESYVRPDGGVYLGTYELPKDPGGAVMVWGDANMDPHKAAAASLAYRKKLQETFVYKEDVR